MQKAELSFFPLFLIFFIPLLFLLSTSFFRKVRRKWRLHDDIVFSVFCFSSFFLSVFFHSLFCVDESEERTGKNRFSIFVFFILEEGTVAESRFWFFIQFYISSKKKFTHVFFFNVLFFFIVFWTPFSFHITQNETRTADGE